MTKIFCDIAELDLIKKFNKKKIVKGFTTNPSLMRKAGAKDYKSYSKKILKICNNKPVSLEVFADNYREMKQQALQINTWGKNVYVKVPITNSKGKFMGKVIKELNNQNIKLNITAIYSANVEILWASVREPYNYLQAQQLNCHIITVPPIIIEKIENFGKSIQELTKETVQSFLADSRKSKFKI